MERQERSALRADLMVRRPQLVARRLAPLVVELRELLARQTPSPWITFWLWIRGSERKPISFASLLPSLGIRAQSEPSYFCVPCVTKAAVGIKGPYQISAAGDAGVLVWSEPSVNAPWRGGRPYGRETWRWLPLIGKSGPFLLPWIGLTPRCAASFRPPCRVSVPRCHQGHLWMTSLQ